MACILCTEKGSKCAFHTMVTPDDLKRVLQHKLEKHGALAFADFIAAGFAGLEASIPEAIVEAMADTDVSRLYKRFGRDMDKDDFSPNDLRRLAADALTLAMIADASSDDVGPEPVADDDQ